MSGKNITMSSAEQNGQSTRSIASKMYEDDKPHVQGVARIESFARLQKLTAIYAKS